MNQLSAVDTEIGQRQSMIDELASMGFFDSDLIAKINQMIVLKTEVRLTVWKEWWEETVPLARENGVSEEKAVSIGLLSRFDLYGVEEVVEAAREYGPKIAYERLLESALQFATRRGDEYVIAGQLGRLTWKGIWNLLNIREWKAS